MNRNATMYRIENSHDPIYKPWTTNDMGRACKELSEVYGARVSVLPRAGARTMMGAPLVEAEISWVNLPEHGQNYLRILEFTQDRKDDGPISLKEFYRFYEDYCDYEQESWPVAEED